MKILLITVFSLFCLFGSAQDNDCKKFKDGLFVLKSDMGTFYLKRKGNRQIEKKKNEKGKVVLEVKWINECTYTLKLIKEVGKKSMSELPKEFMLTVKILEVKENSYIQVTTANLVEMELKDEIIKVNSFSNY